jgi:hypothetical protein
MTLLTLTAGHLLLCGLGKQITERVSETYLLSSSRDCGENANAMPVRRTS